jgi:predicted transcriptional regulator
MYRGIEARPSFIELCIRDKVLPEEIDDFVQGWHQSDSNEELYEFLGMTWDEYATWVTDASILPLIIASHKTNRPLRDLIQDAASLAAPARSSDTEKAFTMTRKLLEITADIVQTQVASTPMKPAEIASSLRKVFRTLQQIRKAEDTGTVPAPQMLPEDVRPEGTSPKTSGPQDSIREDKVICLECGAEMRQLTSKHLVSHGMDQKQYRKKYGFSTRTPLSAKSLTKVRRTAAKKRGLPEKLMKFIEARRQKAAESTKAATKTDTGAVSKPKQTRIRKKKAS